MDNLFYVLMYLLLFYFSPRHNIEIAFLRLQLEIQRRVLERHGVTRIFANPEDKMRLLALGAELGHDVKDILVMVTYPSYRRWLRKTRGGETLQKPGRPKIVCPAICQLIVQMAKNNATWGLSRIYGELKKLGHLIAPNTIKRILRENNIPSPPTGHGRPPNGTYGKFIAANLHSLVACDFFVKKVPTVRGSLRAYCLVFIHLGSRRVFCSPVTFNSHANWMKQQARNAAMWMKDEGINLKYIIRDNDGIYAGSFDKFFKELTGAPNAGGVKGSEDGKAARSSQDDAQEVHHKWNAVVNTSVRAPNMNSYCESFIGHFKAECLNYIFCISCDQLNYVIKGPSVI